VELTFAQGDFLTKAPLELIKGFGQAQVKAYLSRMKEFPQGIARPFIFQYLDGLVFIESIKRAGGGFAAVDRAFADPPETTEQILHPERYLDRDRPTTIVPPPPPAGYRVLTANTLGELGVQIVLEGHLQRDYKATQSAGWDGDLIQLLGPEGEGEPILVWYTTWEFSKAAIAMFKVRRPETGMTGMLQKLDGLVHSVTVSGKDVIVLEGVPEDRHAEIAKSIIENAVKEELRVVRSGFLDAE
jgi:hypothetical protein